MQTKRPIGYLCEKLSMAHQRFKNDIHFDAFDKFLLNKKHYFQRMDMEQVIREIAWHVDRCNLRRLQTRPWHKEDYAIFAAYLCLLYIQPL